MLNSQSVLRNDVTLYCLARYVCFESSFVFFFRILAQDLNWTRSQIQDFPKEGARFRVKCHESPVGGGG